MTPSCTHFPLVKNWNGFLNKDFSPKEVRTGEWNFWESNLAGVSGNILELASGANRLLLRLVEKLSNQFFGLELAPEMIEFGSLALERLPEEKGCRVTIRQGDMRSFRGEFSVRFSCILIGHESFWSNFNLGKDHVMRSQEEKMRIWTKQAESCLECMMETLEPSGLFFIDASLSNSRGIESRWWDSMAEKFYFTHYLVYPYTGKYNWIPVLVGLKN